MDLKTKLLASKPDMLRREGETRYSWGTTLSVVVRVDNEIGQFASEAALTRQQVESAVLEFLREK